MSPHEKRIDDLGGRLAVSGAYFYRFPKALVRSRRTWIVHTHIDSMNGQIGIAIDDSTTAILEMRFIGLPR